MAKKLRYLFLFLSIVCFDAYSGFATHIVGGELNYKYLGNNKYEVRLTVYRDCINGVPPFDDPLSIGIFDSTNHLVDYSYNFTGFYPQGSMTFYNNAVFNDTTYGFLTWPRDSATVPNVINNPCVIPPVNICYRVCHYVDTLTLPFISGGYQLVYEICCRNAIISNIVNPSNIGDTFVAFINDSSVAINNGNPVFNNWPPTFICNNIPFTFDHSATDPDGDSMSYHLCTPLGFNPTNTTQPQPPYDPPYINITWRNPYSLANLLGGVPMAIDSLTGLLTCTPNTLGTFVYGVCVSEYRNGVYLGVTRRDYQINVVNCQLETVAAIQSPLISCGSDIALFQNSSTGNIRGYHWDFGVGSLSNDTSNIFSPTYTYPDTGIYSITLIAYDSLNAACNDTVTGIAEILPPFIGGFDFTINPCTNQVSFSDTSHNYDGTTNYWRWSFGDSATATIKNPIHTYNIGGGTDTVTLIVRTAKGCLDTIVDLVSFPKLITTKFTDSIGCAQNCDGRAEAVSTGGISPYTYQWSTTPVQTSSTATGLCAGWCFVTVTDAQGCTYVDSIFVKGYINNDSSKVLANPDTIFDFQSTQLHVDPSSGYFYSWSPPNGLSNTTTSNPIATPTSTTTYYVTVTDINGCGSVVDTIRIVVLHLKCDASDVYVPNAFTPDGNGHNDVLYVRSRGIKTLYFAIYNRWGQKVFETADQTQGWDGTYNGAKCDPDVFVYYLEATCLKDQTYFKKGNITLLR